MSSTGMNTRSQSRRTTRAALANSASPSAAPTITNETSARILSEDTTARRKKYTIFWPGREDETKVVPATDILQYVAPAFLRAFRVRAEWAKSQELQAEKREEDKRAEAEDKVREYLARQTGVAAREDGEDVESSSGEDEDIPYLPRPKWAVKTAPAPSRQVKKTTPKKKKSPPKKPAPKKPKKTPASAGTTGIQEKEMEKELDPAAEQTQPRGATRHSLKRKATEPPQDPETTSPVALRRNPARGKRARTAEPREKEKGPETLAGPTMRDFKNEEEYQAFVDSVELLNYLIEDVYGPSS
ncbi:hypothetical protein QBC39DRAFT_381416 [Podospora conica]|nr:hypothetical protein QBC39DRAFT_381416 [Schizothecium conicum]